jgi:UPF0176 protein
MSAPVLNIAAYRFVTLADLPALRERLQAAAESRGLKGTVLLAEEGINIFLAGAEAEVRGWLQQLAEDARFANLEVKESASEAQPFQRLKVKIKREIIRMDHPTIRPEGARAPAVDASTLARWLDAGVDDQGRRVVTLDTRNDFEVDHGAFDGAMDWRLRKFTEFPAQLATHLDTLREVTVVSYCTGGIRCEKAALLMREQGLDHVYQLDGGILKYFETVGQRHYHGGCFVFDERTVLDAALAPVAPAVPAAGHLSE